MYHRHRCLWASVAIAESLLSRFLGLRPDKYIATIVRKRVNATRRLFVFRANLALKAKSFLLLAVCYPFHAGATETPKPVVESSQLQKTSKVKVKPGANELIEVHPKLSYGQGLLNVSLRDDAEKSEVQSSWLKMQTPTENAFDLVKLLPGANVSTVDGSGVNAQDSLSVRGLDGTEIGYLLEGMPMNDLADNGGSASQFADTENLQQISLQQGSTNIEDPLLTGAGGVMSLKFIGPKNKLSGQGAITFGNHNEMREFVRLDTGYIGNTGIKGFASFSNTFVDNWHGPGDNKRKHVDFKFTKEFGTRATVSILGSYNRGQTEYYPPQALGTDLYGHGNTESRDKHSINYWKLWRDSEQTIYLGLPVHIKVAKHFSIDALAYGQRAFGNWPWGNPNFENNSAYDNGAAGHQPVPLTNPSGSPQSPWVDANNPGVIRADGLQETSRAGILLTLHADYKHHHVSLGWWGDMGHDIQKSPFAPVSPNGESPDIWGNRKHDHLLTPGGSELLSRGFSTRSYVNSVFISDDMVYGKNRISLGFKEVWMDDRGHNKVPGLQGKVKRNYSIPLPRFSYVRELTPNDSLFIHVSTNFRTPNFAAFYYGMDPQAGTLSNIAAGSLKPEYSVEEQIGWRHRGKIFGASATFFNYNFWHRQFKSILSDHNGRYYGSYLNAGSQTSRGVDLELAMRKTYGFSPYFSFEYVDAKIGSNLPYDGGHQPTKGKNAINTPPILVGAGLTYEYKGFYAVFSAHYTASQYGTYLNNQKIPGYVTEDIGAGYKGKDVGFMHAPTIRFNVINLSDRHYFSGAMFPEIGCEAGQTPYYYLSGGTTITGSIQAGF